MQKYIASHNLYNIQYIHTYIPTYIHTYIHTQETAVKEHRALLDEVVKVTKQISTITSQIEYIEKRDFKGTHTHTHIHTYIHTYIHTNRHCQIVANVCNDKEFLVVIMLELNCNFNFINTQTYRTHIHTCIHMCTYCTYIHTVHTFIHPYIHSQGVLSRVRHQIGEAEVEKEALATQEAKVPAEINTHIHTYNTHIHTYITHKTKRTYIIHIQTYIHT